MSKISKTLFGPLGAGGGAFLLAAASLVSYALGWVRDALFARTFGVTAFTDSYFKAFLLPDTLLTIFITGALLGLVIPLYIQAQKISEEEGRRVFGTFFVVLNGLYFVAACILLIFLGPILAYMFPDTPPEQYAVLTKITSILLFSNFFFALSNFLGHFLLAQKRFFSYSFAPLLYNGGIILGIILLKDTVGIYAAAWGAFIGAGLHFILRLVDFLIAPRKFHCSFHFRHPLFWELVQGIWPKVIALLSLQVGFYFFARLGDATLGAGNYSAFQYARNLQSFSVSLIGVSLATAIFPFLSEFAAEKKLDHFMFRLEKSLRQILFLALPAAVGMALLANELVRFTYGDRPENHLTIAVLLPLALTVPFESINHLLVRAFHGLKSTILPMLSSLLFLGLLIGISAVLVFSFHWGIIAFGIAYLIAFGLQNQFLFFWLRRLAVPFPWSEFFPKFFKMLVLTALMGIVVFLIQMLLAETLAFFRLVISGVIGAAVFLGGAFLWRMPEVAALPLWKWQEERKAKNTKGKSS